MRRNVSLIICPLILLIVLHVPIPVQSYWYELTSIKIDNEDPPYNVDEFRSDTFRNIRLEYIGDETSRLLVSNASVRDIRTIPSEDFFCRILDYVVIDTGDPNRIVDCLFKNVNEVSLYYESIKPDRIFEEVNYPVNFVKQYDCVVCKGRVCNRSTCDGNDVEYIVSKKARIYVEKITTEDANGYALKRFIVRNADEDETMAMIFTSKSFNTTTVRTEADVMLSIKIREALFKILIQFQEKKYADDFYAYVTNNGDVNPNLPVNEPSSWNDNFYDADNDATEETDEDE